jgi:hypothetical protein
MMMQDEHDPLKFIDRLIAKAAREIKDSRAACSRLEEELSSAVDNLKHSRAYLEMLEGIKAKIAPPASTPPSPPDGGIPEGFTAWSGGECPVPRGSPFEVVHRSGKHKMSTEYDWPYANFNWKHGDFTPVKPETDIIAYRILPDTAEEGEAERRTANEMTQPAIPDGFTQWVDQGSRFKGDTRVEVMFRSGRIAEHTAGELHNFWDTRGEATDIVAYRVVAYAIPPARESEGERGDEATTYPKALWADGVKSLSEALVEDSSFAPRKSPTDQVRTGPAEIGAASSEKNQSDPGINSIIDDVAGEFKTGHQRASEMVEQANAAMVAGDDGLDVSGEAMLQAKVKEGAL